MSRDARAKSAIDVRNLVNLFEGERYTVSGVKLSGELLGLEEELIALIDVNPGDTFSAERLNAIAKRITDRMATLGYAFATANPMPEPDKENRTVAFTIVVDPGRRVYVRRVNIGGNSRTKDEVIRREVRQYESAWYDSEKVRLSRDRIDRLGFFESVNIETPAVPSAPDQVDVNVTVKERATGNIQIGAGYSSTEGLVLTAGISQQNLFGTGNALEPCFKAYEKKNKLTDNFYWSVKNSNIPKLGYTNDKEDKFLCTAPLFQQAFRWFREKYGLFISPSVISYENSTYLWFFEINSIKLPFGTDLGETYDFETYEEAELACLERLIDKITNKKIFDFVTDL